MIGDSNDETNFPHKLLFTERQVLRLRKIFANNSSANIRLSKTRMSTIVQSGGFLVDLYLALAEARLRGGVEAEKQGAPIQLKIQ